MGARGQIFIQDVSTSLVIGLITVLGLIAFVNAYNSTFENSMREEHAQAAGERILRLLLDARTYGFNRGEYAVERAGLLGFISSLNDDSVYEQFRANMSLYRERAAYDVLIEAVCGKGQASGGKTGAEQSVAVTALAVADDGDVCTVTARVSMR